ncbi:hypothetical protein CMI47_15290 [Candidatus Pacearchaeota archaeon]|nr:hypothetical protein [Candidatus Pacearchaeota archaeon]|tara:strand:- start:5205 stop:5972 length:768 start_codon:yes stop_codon:yes gene_type:complete
MISKIKTSLGVLKLMKNYPTYFRDYLKLIDKKYLLYKLRNGIKYKVRAKTTDRFIINEIWIHNSYTPKGFEIKESDTVLDIGAHIGVFSIFASHLSKNGKVYSFEPFQENFNLLKDNINLNETKNIIPINKAISNKNSKQSLFISESENKGSGSLHQNNNSKKVTIEAISLQSFLKEYKIKTIDFLKIDCEGAEYEILYNCPKNLLQKIKKISMEYHNLSKENNGSALKKFLEENGFAVTLIPEKKRGTIYAKLI